MIMTGQALFIDYEYCSGCRSCEFACRNEHDLKADQWGIRVLEDKPWQLDDGTWNWNYIPTLSKLCDLCAEKTSRGEEPSCVMHCQAKVIEYGDYDELLKRLSEKAMSYIIRP